MRSLPGFEELRSLGNAPRLHPNGFIQLDLDDRERLHVWPDVPVRVRTPAAPIHDHVFGFESQAHLGAIVDRRYDLVEDPDGGFELHGVVCYVVGKKDAGLHRLDDKRYRLVLTDERRVTAPGSYVMPPSIFHESVAEGLALTVIAMTAPDPARPARVVCRRGGVPAEIFKRDGGPEERERLWSIIGRARRAVI